jgi:hypothetical protein
VRRLPAAAMLAALGTLFPLGQLAADHRADGGRMRQIGRELVRLHGVIDRQARALDRGVPEQLQPWLRLAACESGLRSGALSNDGRYFGALQFALPSWRAAGGRGLPTQASLIEQLYRGEVLQRIEGWGAWPACSVQVGLR